MKRTTEHWPSTIAAEILSPASQARVNWLRVYPSAEALGYFHSSASRTIKTTDSLYAKREGWRSLNEKRINSPHA